jgi:hypothetical protein
VHRPQETGPRVAAGTGEALPGTLIPRPPGGTSGRSWNRAGRCGRRVAAGPSPAADRRLDRLGKLIQVLRFGCSNASIADCACGATTIRERRDEWIKAGIFGELRQIARDAYDRIVGLVLEEIAIASPRPPWAGNARDPPAAGNWA